MAGEVQDNIWPLPKFHFKVEVEGGITASFQEVSGLDSEVDVVEYRHGDSPEFSTIKMPGLRKSSDVTLKKGTFTGDIDFYDWFAQNNMNTIERRTVQIMLLNESGDAEIIWTLTNAFPKQVQGTDLNSQSSDVAVETLVLAHEGLAITTA
ncbi:MAG: phage tail protein [Salibacteraceae bacterium]|jgi:phage tail-like protein|nr:phage tail protein [Salibacteraceae bacterium]MDP4686061.1 phage tail protein [Salibacteraceae bacterium]MDP4764684.1 phage tail protein [Salibacteraceae bacterium]MDP4843987.1 phage tail protein [Salibacteraceae bacterium]MDP4935482.1 phage tail protein [Salibacteraceae bacterium]